MRDIRGIIFSPLGKDYQKIQILTIEELINGKKPDTPSWVVSVGIPDVHKKKEGESPKLL